MSRYDDRIVDQVQSANDIVEVIGQYVPLKRSGRNMKGLCPFHQEKSPSFMVHPEKQIFHCFGCGAGGDAFSFLMRYENMSFPEALRRLAERAHITLPEKSEGRDGEKSDSEKFYEIYRLACEFYHQRFLSPAGGKARDYFLKRGFEDALARELQMGWADESWDSLFQFLSKKGFPEAMLIKSGLVCRSAKGNVFDLFRARLLFPIRNLQGKVVAFGGRILDKREGPKYLNSPENPVFYKRRELFGLHISKKFIDREKPRIFVVEGYFGFLRLYQSGFKAVVATLGTALTDEHVRVLKRFAEEAVVIYDGDKAGEAASIRGLEVFLEGDMNVKLARLEGGLDPDDFIREKGPEAFRAVIDGARDFFDFKLEVLQKRFDRRDTLGVMKIASDFLETFSKIKNPILLDHYLKRLASSLAVNENTLRSEMAKFKKKEVVQGSRRVPEKEPAHTSAESLSEEEVICFALAVENPKWRKVVLETLEESEVGDPRLKELYRSFKSEESAPPLPLAKVLNRIGDESFKNRLVAVFSFDWKEPDKEKAFGDCLRNIRKKIFERRLAELRQKISAAERQKNNPQLTVLMKEYQALLKVKSS